MKAAREMTGTELDKLMKGLRLTDSELARQAGVKRQYISQLRGRKQFVLSDAATGLVWPIIERVAAETKKTIAEILEAS